jgi:hypothetical protein
MKTFIAVEPALPQETPRQIQLTIPELILGGGFLGLITALGVPKIISLFAQSRVETVGAERRREDSIYKALTDANQKTLDGLLEVNRTLQTGLISAMSELFQLAMTQAVDNSKLSNELKEIREVLSKREEK